MKESRVIYATKRSVRSDLNRTYNLYSSRVVRIERDIEPNKVKGIRNVSCQCNTRNLTCTCRKLAAREAGYFASPKQVYRYSDWRSFADIGVGSVKALPRKRTRRIYLPETKDRGVGSEDLTPIINRRNRQRRVCSYYDTKRISSKCVGGFIENDDISLISKKLSPIVKKKSGATSPKTVNLGEQHKNTGSYNIHRHTTTTPTQVNPNDLYPKQQDRPIDIRTYQTSTTIQADATKDILPSTTDKLKTVGVKNKNETGRDYSSDSLVQHVHNFENPSDEKHSKMSVDPMENKLEREYRKIFSTKSKDKPSIDKPLPDFKSASLLRRRFEALRRGLVKKDSKRESLVINEQRTSSQVDVPSRKDVSIASDPPSLEGRSYSNTKVYSPSPSVNDNVIQPKIAHNKSSRGKKKKCSSQWSPSELAESKCEGVQGMFKLWGKRFNLEEDYYAKTSPAISDDATRKAVRELEDKANLQSSTQQDQKKKPGKKFFFFGRKNKDREPKSFKQKKGVTAGRCELKDGLMIKVGGTKEYPKEPAEPKEQQADYENMLRKAWVEKFITNARESRNSVQIRWDNKMYGTSSSTVLELMDSVYKHTGIDLRSRSEITTGESSQYRSFTKQRVHFVQQDIEAWMIPKTLRDIQKHTDNMRYTNIVSDGYSQKIKLVLHARPHNKKSEYIIINVPEGYFSQSSSNDTQTQSSDEQIYKIVEYETPDLKKIKEQRHMATGDHVTKKIEAIDTVAHSETEKEESKNQENMPSDKIVKNPSPHRDVAIQGSTVFVPMRCDVIEVGIITQRDVRDVRKPILKIQDELTDDESERNIIVQKKCELAESYLQDYYRNWPLEIDMFSWCISDSHLRPTNNSSPSLNNQGDGSKSCTNIYEDFQGSTIVSSCETSSCSHCIALEDEKRPDDSLKCKLLSKFKKKSFLETPINTEKRVLPKDSVEVCKKRQMYACSNKSKWTAGAESDPRSSDSNSKLGQIADCLKSTKPCWKIPESKTKKHIRNKHVSLPGCDAMSKMTSRLTDESPEGILSFKGSSRCNLCKKNSPSKHASVVPKPVCEIPQPPCKDFCINEKKPPCNKKNSPPCDLPNSPRSDTPIAAPNWSPSNSPPKCVKPDAKLKSPTQCNTPPCKKVSSQCSGCHTPPCTNIPGAKQTNRQYPNDEYPWPLKNQISQQPSRESGISLKMSPRPSPKTSNESVKKKKKDKDCKPDCANRPKSPQLQTPPAPPPTVNLPLSPPPADCATDCSNRQKISGLHLKKMPSKKKTCSEECLAWDSNGPGVIRLNSKENLTIRMKKETPSTQEIRESCNIKVRDEDGQTLYERIDYRKSGDGNKCTLLRDMYKDSHVNRVSTPSTVHKVVVQDKSQNDVHEGKSASSMDHLIEINFTLKLKQGDKGTDINIKNAGDHEVDKQKKETRINESQKDIYIMQDRTDPTPENGTNNDVNIKIVIKNYKTDLIKTNEQETYTLHRNDKDNFAKRISEKFQTVSTGYSDVIDHHTFSVHRATVDLTSSADRLKTDNKPSGEIISNQLTTDVRTLATPSQSLIEHSITDQTANSMKYEDNSIPSIKNSFTKINNNSTEISLNETDEFDGYKSEKYSSIRTRTCNIETADETSDETLFYDKLKLRTKAEKKQMLKRIFARSSAVKKTENKQKIKNMLRAILTSDSSANEMAVTSNELTKELTYGSLDPSYFRDTDSMNNYYELDSQLSLEEASGRKKLNPTKNNSDCSETETYASFEGSNSECLCSALANKLYIGNEKGGCCCKRILQKDKEISCEVRADEDLLQPKTCIDVETQNSHHRSIRNIPNVSVKSKTQSFVIKNASVQINKEKSSYGGVKFENNSIHSRNNTAMTVNKDFVMGLSSEEIVVLNSNVVRESKRGNKHKHRYYESKRIADILQLNETKRAVLKIYAEKIVSNEGEKIVSKLPKFDNKQDLDISNYEEIVTGCKRVSKRNLLMMSINR